MRTSTMGATQTEGSVMTSSISASPAALSATSAVLATTTFVGAPVKASVS